MYTLHVLYIVHTHMIRWNEPIKEIYFVNGNCTVSKILVAKFFQRLHGIMDYVDLFRANELFVCEIKLSLAILPSVLHPLRN